jgi:tetratricopeptide (TPR) repeat protein
LLIVLALNCSVEKNTGMSRNYHNLVSRYNIYFNGIQSYKKGLRRLGDQFKDDYSQILPVFRYGDESAIASVAGEMDKAIAKASKVITIHSITAKPYEKKKNNLTEKEQAFFEQKEFNNWVDDSYLLMGKAQMYKQDYFNAFNTLKFVSENALDDHVKYEARIWMARVYNEEGSYNYSREILESLDEDPDFPKDLTADFDATYADFYLKQEKLEESISYLEDLIDEKLKKNDKVRYYYILAQVYKKTGDDNRAYKLFAKVVKMSPPYDMTFNARINQAESFTVTPENVNEIKKILRKMLKDEKNKEYLDQIYFAYGNISLKENKEKQAIEYFKKSAQSSISNNKQKGISYLTLGNLYFRQEDYVNAQPYYDSALMVLEPDFPGYEVISKKTGSLNRLVENIIIVETQDSLQRIAAMSPSKRNAYIDQIISDLREEEKRQKELEQSAGYSLSNEYETKRKVNQELSRSGKWYFYNPAVVDLGKNEFRQKWGDRKLEDNWRRKNKSVSQANIYEIEKGIDSTQQSSENVQVMDVHKRKYYMIGLPLTDSLKKISDYRIAGALFNMGQIYANELKNLPNANEAFEDLFNRYPGSEYELSTLYYLYELKRKSGNSSGANKYKNLIISKYPESEFAKMLSDPDYLRKQNEKKQQELRSYNQTYNEYLTGQYNKVILNSEAFLHENPEHDLSPKYWLLRAYAIAKVQDIRSFKQALEDVVNNTGDCEEKTRAKELIVHFNQEIPELKVEEEEKVSVQIYSLTPDEPHFAAIAIEGSDSKENQLIFNVINFNLDQFPQSEYSSQVQSLGGITGLLTIGGIGGMKEAKDYLNKLLADKSITDELQGKVYYPFIISQTNLKALLKDKSVSVYLRFYNRNYFGAGK